MAIVAKLVGCLCKIDLLRFKTSIVKLASAAYFLPSPVGYISNDASKLN